MVFVSCYHPRYVPRTHLLISLACSLYSFEKRYAEAFGQSRLLLTPFPAVHR